MQALFAGVLLLISFCGVLAIINQDIVKMTTELRSATLNMQGIQREATTKTCNSLQRNMMLSTHDQISGFSQAMIYVIKYSVLRSIISKPFG